MTKDELIAKQQLEIENLKQLVANHIDGFNDIHTRLVCVGGGLNDNILGYTEQQIRKDLRPIAKICESFLSEENKNA